MKVKLAKTAGFCMGVRRAMEIAFSEAKKDNGSLFTYGPLIHNQQVLDLLKSKGVSVKKSIQSNDRGRIIIRAHGVTPEEKGVIKASHLKLIDATCPKVLKVQAIIKRVFFPHLFAEEIEHNKRVVKKRYSQETLNKNMFDVLKVIYYQQQSNCI